MKSRTLSFILFILFVSALYVFQTNAVLPFVEYVAMSNFFLNEDTELADSIDVKNDKTRTALIHCHNYFIENFELDDSASFPEDDYTAWPLGDYAYLIRSHVEVSGENSNRENKFFACRIKYNGGDDLAYSNWSVSGFDFN